MHETAIIFATQDFIWRLYPDPEVISCLSSNLALSPEEIQFVFASRGLGYKKPVFAMDISEKRTLLTVSRLPTALKMPVAPYVRRRSVRVEGTPFSAALFKEPGSEGRWRPKQMVTGVSSALRTRLPEATIYNRDFDKKVAIPRICITYMRRKRISRAVPTRNRQFLLIS